MDKNEIFEEKIKEILKNFLFVKKKLKKQKIEKIIENKNLVFQRNRVNLSISILEDQLKSLTDIFSKKVKEKKNTNDKFRITVKRCKTVNNVMKSKTREILNKTEYISNKTETKYTSNNNDDIKIETVKENIKALENENKILNELYLNKLNTLNYYKKEFEELKNRENKFIRNNFFRCFASSLK